jgi:hypothetical protein
MTTNRTRRRRRIKSGNEDSKMRPNPIPDGID